MKISEIKQKVKKADSVISKTFFDNRYQQFYTVENREKHFFNLKYEKRGEQKESVEFILYNIEQKQHTEKTY
jgi:hypothetical protein